MKKLLAFSLLCASANALAGSLICSGTVEELSYHATGNFMVRLSSMNTPVMFCNPDQEWVIAGTPYKTGPEACKMLYATFLSARTTKQNIHNMYWDGDQVPTSCTGWVDWTKANIRHYKL